jgi:hypothetical protein
MPPFNQSPASNNESLGVKNEVHPSVAVSKDVELALFSFDQELRNKEFSEEDLGSDWDSSMEQDGNTYENHISTKKQRLQEEVDALKGKQEERDSMLASYRKLQTPEQISFLVSFLGAVENSLHNNIDPKNFLEFLNAFDKNAVLEAFKKYSENLLSRSSTFTIDGVKYNNTYFINKVVRYIHDADLASFDDGQAQEFSQEEKQELFDYYRLLGAIKKTVVNNVVYNRADEFIEKDSDVNFVLPNLKHF